MKITRLSTAVLEANFDWVLVKIETDDGITGYGEGFMGPAVTAVIRELGTILIGQDPSNLDPLLRRLHLSTIYASPGLVRHAIGAIECALLDAVGQRFGIPVWQVLGGRYRDEVRIYADCHAGEALESITPLLEPRTPQWMHRPGDPERKGEVSVKHHGWDVSGGGHLTPEAYGRRAREMAARGFRILKFDVDVPTPYDSDQYNRDLSRAEIEYMASLVAAAREAVGRDVGLAIDCHWNYTTEAAIQLARAIEPYDLLWLEDPVPPENIRAVGEVQRNTRVPVATGENHYLTLDFERLIVEAGLRVLAPDVQKVGLWEGRRLAAMADLHYVNLTWHNISGPIGIMAGAHLCAATPNLLAMEWHAASVPFFDEIVRDAGGPLIRYGKIRVPDRPGLGIRLDEDAAARYRKPGEGFFE